MYLLISMVRSLKSLWTTCVPHKLLQSQQLASIFFSQGLHKNIQKYFFDQAVSFNKCLWCLLDGTEQFEVGRGSLGHQQPNSTQLWKMKGGGFRQLKHTSLPAHSTSRAHAARPACLSVAADLSQRYMCLALHPPLLCWHCTLRPI